MYLEIEVAKYYLEHKTTVRECAKIFGKSKSTIHNYLHVYLPRISPSLYEKVSAQAQLNFDEKHIRGGNATKQKYLNFTHAFSGVQKQANTKKQ